MQKVELYLEHNRAFEDALFILTVRALEHGVLARTKEPNEYITGPFCIVYYNDNVRGLYASTMLKDGKITTTHYSHASELFTRFWDIQHCHYYNILEPETEELLLELGILEAVCAQE